jgi:hypothetical protein
VVALSLSLPLGRAGLAGADVQHTNHDMRWLGQCMYYNEKHIVYYKITPNPSSPPLSTSTVLKSLEVPLLLSCIMSARRHLEEEDGPGAIQVLYLLAS